MRKIAIILLTLCLGWLCGTDIPSGELPYSSGSAQASIEAAGLDQWTCERECNFDFTQPQSIAGVESAQTLSVRTVPILARSGIKCGVASDPSGCRVVTFSEFNEHPLFSGASAVDIYVYRLRKLII